MNQPNAHSPKPRVALLVDGENISPAVAGQIIMRALPYGDLAIRRVYGNCAALGAWNSAPGLRLIHSGIGKNATDLLMAVEAMGFMLGGQADVLVLATSDRDFVHLATYLREQGHRVIGIGEPKAPESFRKSCTTFHELKIEAAPPGLKAAPAPQLAPVKPKTPPTLDEKIRSLIQTEGDAGSVLIARLGGRMHTTHKIKISELPEKTWRAYLMARPHLYHCDARGPEAHVRLRS